MLKYVSQVLNYNEKKDLLLSCQLHTTTIHSFSVKIVSKGKVLRSDFFDQSLNNYCIIYLIVAST